MKTGIANYAVLGVIIIALMQSCKKEDIIQQTIINNDTTIINKDTTIVNQIIGGTSTTDSALKAKIVGTWKFTNGLDKYTKLAPQAIPTIQSYTVSYTDSTKQQKGYYFNYPITSNDTTVIANYTRVLKMYADNTFSVQTIENGKPFVDSSTWNIYGEGQMIDIQGANIWDMNLTTLTDSMLILTDYNSEIRKDSLGTIVYEDTRDKTWTFKKM